MEQQGEIECGASSVLAVDFYGEENLVVGMADRSVKVFRLRGATAELVIVAETQLSEDFDSVVFIDATTLLVRGKSCLVYAKIAS